MSEKSLWRCGVILLALLLVVGCGQERETGEHTLINASVSAEAAQRERDDPGSGQAVAPITDERMEQDPLEDGAPLVQLVWFYKPPASSEKLPILADHFDRYILTVKDEPVREALREEGVTGPFLQYLRFDAIHDPCKQAEEERGSSCDCDSSPWSNNVAWEDEDICRIRDQHPDWFLRDEEGELIYNDRFVMMDPGKQGWREFWLERARWSQEELGWDGVFLDNVEASRDKQRRRVGGLEDYQDDQSYQAAVEEFLKYIYEGYFEPEGRPLFANIIEMKGQDGWFRYLRYLDGAMDEGWSVGWSSDGLSVAQWEEHLHRAEQSQALGEELILIAQGEENDSKRQQFAFASYLLIANGRAAFRYSHSNEYDKLWLYYNYQLAEQLGPPLGARYRDGKLWRRDFLRGTVLVDPREQKGWITIHPFWEDLKVAPGRIESEAYRMGGQGVAYSDTSEGNSGGAYRDEDVDIEPCADGPACYNVGWIREGEWLTYRLHFTRSGDYLFKFRATSPRGNNHLRLELVGTPTSTRVEIPRSDGWNDWLTAESQPIAIEAGTYILKVIAEGERFNLNFMEVSTR